MVEPPPYESVIRGDGSSPIYPRNEQAEVAEFEIQVTDPIKQGDGVSSFVTFKVRTITSNSNYTRPVNEVVRRFRDFDWLHARLVSKNKGIIVPALPEKNAVQKFQMTTEFIEERRRALQVFVNKVARHPILRESKELQIFLEANDEAWMLELARAQAEMTAQTKSVNGALQWLKNLQHTASNLVSGKSDDTLEDTEYIKVRDYINNLEGHLHEAHRQAARLVKKEMELAGALSEFGAASEHLGKFDDNGEMNTAFVQLCKRAQQVALTSRQRTDLLASNFEAPLKEFARTIKSVQTTIADRAAALSLVSQAKSDLDNKKIKLAKLRGTPGQKEDKITEAERELNEADQRLRNARIFYETIAARMTEELNRFQKERAAEMNAVLREFALCQAEMAKENAKAWTSFLLDIQPSPQS